MDKKYINRGDYVTLNHGEMANQICKVIGIRKNKGEAPVFELQTLDSKTIKVTDSEITLVESETDISLVVQDYHMYITLNYAVMKELFLCLLSRDRYNQLLAYAKTVNSTEWNFIRKIQYQ